MRVLIASHNPGKIDRFKNLLKDLENIELISLDDIGLTAEIDEPFLTSQENALHKAKEYSKLSGLVTIAIDDSAKTNFLPNNEQPGVFLKRFSADKKELTEQEILDTWKKIIGKYPQDDKCFIWDSSIAFCDPSDNSCQSIIVEKIDYVIDFSPVIAHGYPMGSFLSPKPNGKPYSEFTEEEKLERDHIIFAEFVKIFREWLKIEHKKVQIIKARLGDEIGITNVAKQTWLDTYKNEEYKITKEDILSKDFNSQKKLEGWRETLATNGSGSRFVVVAKNDGEIIGFCSAIKGMERNEIGAFYVLPSFQGKGIGKKLLTKSIEWLGIDKMIFLQVAIFNKRTIDFYTKFGFSVIDTPVEFKELPSGKKFPLIEMQLNKK